MFAGSSVCCHRAAPPAAPPHHAGATCPAPAPAGRPADRTADRSSRTSPTLTPGHDSHRRKAPSTQHRIGYQPEVSLIQPGRCDRGPEGRTWYPARGVLPGTRGVAGVVLQVAARGSVAAPATPGGAGGVDPLPV